MPQLWLRTRRKRLMLAALNAAARVRSSFFGLRRDRSTRVDDEIRSILVIEPWNIGDVILALPFLSQLRVRFPRAKVTMLAQPHAAQILEGTGLVDDFIPANITWSAERTPRSLNAEWRELWRLRKELRAREFEIGFSCRLHVREHVLLGLSGATRRVGYAFGEGDALLTDPVPVDNPHRQKVDDWLRLFDPFGGMQAGPIPSLCVSEPERARARDMLADRGITASDVLIGIHPGASLPEKRWPLESFRRVASVLGARDDVRVLVFVEPSSYGDSLADVSGVSSAKVGLRELIALIDRCDLLVCNDSGPMHIAGALDVPTVAVFGSGIDRWFSPLGKGHEVVTPEAYQSSTSKNEERSGIRSPVAVPVPAVLGAIETVLRRLRLPANFPEP